MTPFIVSCKISTLNFLYHLLFISSILIKKIKIKKKIIAIFIAHIKFIWYICSEFENISIHNFNFACLAQLVRASDR